MCQSSTCLAILQAKKEFDDRDLDIYHDFWVFVSNWLELNPR